MINILSALNSINDLNRITTKEEALIVGKEDRNIGISTDGKIINLSPSFDERDKLRGTLEIPTNNGEIVVQWGQVTVDKDGTTDYDFNKNFPKKCFQVLGTPGDTGSAVTLNTYMIDRKAFRVRVEDLQKTMHVSWLAFGN